MGSAVRRFGRHFVSKDNHVALVRTVLQSLGQNSREVVDRRLSDLRQGDGPSFRPGSGVGRQQSQPEKVPFSATAPRLGSYRKQTTHSCSDANTSETSSCPPSKTRSKACSREAESLTS